MRSMEMKKMKSLRLDNDAYKEKYINTEYYKNDIFSSKIVDNFLTDEELNQFDLAANSEHIYYVKDTCMAPEAKRLFGQEIEEHVTAHYYIFDNFYDNPAWRPLVDILQPKLEKEFGNLSISHIHVLDSYFPYGLHNDADQPNMVIAPKPAWTLIIPFNDYPSKTYVFNERSGFKDPWSWINSYNIQPNDDYSISYDTFTKDFAPITDYELMKYLTPECVFQWKRGSCFAADRYKYHCSDNYYNHGITHKKAIIMWTSIEE